MIAATNEGHAADHVDVAVVTSDGSILSWQELFDEYTPALVSYARSRGVRAPEDLVQDVLAVAVEKLPDFEGDRRGLRSFLFSVAYRRIADEHRRTYGRRETLVAEHIAQADHRDSVEDEVARNAAFSEAMGAFQILGPRERRVLEMRIFDEASPSEVADALGLSNGNVRVIQARALVKVRKYLLARYGESSLASLALPFTFIGGLGSRDLHRRFQTWDRSASHPEPLSATFTSSIPTTVSQATVETLATATGLATVAIKVGLALIMAATTTVGAVEILTSPPAAIEMTGPGETGPAPGDNAAGFDIPVAIAENSETVTTDLVPTAAGEASPTPTDHPADSSSRRRADSPASSTLAPAAAGPSDYPLAPIVEMVGATGSVGEGAGDDTLEAVEPLLDEGLETAVEAAVEVNEHVTETIADVVNGVAVATAEETAQTVAEEPETMVDGLVDPIGEEALPIVGETTVASMAEPPRKKHVTGRPRGR